MSLRDAFGWDRAKPALRTEQTLFQALIDTSNDTLIAIGVSNPAVRFVNDSLMDTTCATDIKPIQNFLRIKNADPRTYPEWSWVPDTRTFKRTNPVVVTEELRERAVFLQKKVDVIAYSIYWINRRRSKIDNGLFFQPFIYLEKERQAQLLKDAQFDERQSGLAPYVVAYAEECEITLREATEDILLQAQLDHEFLAKTEKLRLSIFRKIRAAKNLAELDEVLATLGNHFALV